MMLKKVFLPGICLALTASLLFSADFWVKKKYPDWSQKEIQQILKNSPWARSVEVRTGSGGSGMSSGGGGGRRGGGGGGSSSMGDASGGSGSGGGSAQGSVEMTPSINLVVRWDTALPIKHAVAKQLLDASGGTSPEAAKLLEKQETQYVISVSGVPSRMMRGDPSRMKPQAFLNIKGKDPIQSINFKVGRDQANVIFFLVFPKTTPIVLEDQEVEFTLKSGPIDIKRKFKLKEMVYQDKLEL
jgi:hypothetical protein